MKEKIVNFLKYNWFVVLGRLCFLQIHEICLLSRHIGNVRLYDNISKLQAFITMKSHSLEKGMAIGNSRKGFGYQKAIGLLNDISVYIERVGNDDFMLGQLSILKSYIDYSSSIGVEYKDITKKFCDLLYRYKIDVKDFDNSGVLYMNHTKLLKEIHSDFKHFSKSRYSIRDFAQNEKAINMDTLYEALEIAQKTPSACNRQSQHVHIFTDKTLCSDIFTFQGGNKGFSKEMKAAILITADINSYFINEVHQVYIDGGLYAMNLLYSLHFVGLASIPLTMGMKPARMNKFKKQFHIPDNEMPIVLIGVGYYKENYKVAVSHRKSVSTYTTINK